MDMNGVLIVNSTMQKKKNYNQHRKYQINLLNVFQVNNKDTRLMMSVDANWFFYC